MIDWHSHILPSMDDGSRNTAESLAMLRSLSGQGVDTVAATPHFYANDESVSSFLRRREQSYLRLKAELPDAMPEILLGAEVRYYQGISRMTELKALRIGETKLLLLEMPFSPWPEYTIRELIELSGKSDVRILLAHVERYFSLQKKVVWERLLDSGILMQSNTSFFTSLLTKHRAMSLLKNGGIHLLGTDCHNMDSRPPKFSAAIELVRKKLGENYLRQMSEYWDSLILTQN